MRIDLIPEPQRIRLYKGAFHPPEQARIAFAYSALAPAARMLAATTPGFQPLQKQPDRGDAFRLTLDPTLPPQGYVLRIGRSGVDLAGSDPDGVRNGCRTLKQIGFAAGWSALPVLRLDDWPDFLERGVYYDVTRGRVPKLNRLKELATLLADFKINQLQLYIEHTFAFPDHPEIGRRASPLTAKDIRSLDAHCRDLGIELVPSLASFGHMATVLHHPPYRYMAEDWGIGRYIAPERPFDRHGWTLSPANPDSYKFLDALYAQFLPHFSSSRFNVCCDETYDLGWGQTHAMCQRKGKGRVYLNHILALRKIAARYGKRIMFWGDIIHKYPELIPEIPADVTVCDWGYEHNHPFERASAFRKANVPFLVCPGTSSWRSLFPRIHESMANIHAFACAGKRYGAAGLLNTDWGDRGHFNFMEYSWHGYVFGAEQAWNMRADADAFTERFARVFLHTGRKDVAKAIIRLGDIAHLSLHGYYQSIWEHVLFAHPDDPLFRLPPRPAWCSRNGRIESRTVRLDARMGRSTLKALDAIRKPLSEADNQDGTDPHAILPYWAFAVDTIAAAAHRLAIFGAGGSNTAAARTQHARVLQHLMTRFEKLWRQRNRPSEIRTTLRRYRLAIDSTTA
jgi:hexosaminidase